MTAVLEPPTDVEPVVEPAERRCIVVLAPKGGVGRTTIATNLAVALAGRRPGDVGLVDLSLAFGDVATALLLDPRHGLGRLARVPRPFSPAAVTGLLATHASGLHVLVGPEDPVQGEALGSDDVTVALGAVRDALPTVVVDTAAGLDAATLVAVEHATDLVLVAGLDVATILAQRQALDVLDRLGLVKARRHVVVNRGDRRTGVDLDDVASTLGLPVDVVVPEAKEVAVGLNEGHPIVTSAPRSPAAKAVHQLADRFGSTDAPARRRRRDRTA